MSVVRDISPAESHEGLEDLGETHDRPRRQGAHGPGCLACKSIWLRHHC